ncbi:MAG TPA: hypothetical protein VIW73_05940 [Candidatus Cybelea sp.]
MWVLGKAVDATPEALEAAASDKMMDERLAIAGLPGIFEGKNTLAVGCSLKERRTIRPSFSCHEYNI